MGWFAMGVSAPTSVGELAERHRALLFRIIHTTGRGRLKSCDAEDVLQQVLLRIHKHRYLERYDPAKSAFSTYLYRVVLTTVLNALDRDAHDPLSLAEGLASSPRVDKRGCLTIGEMALVDWRMGRQVEAREFCDRFEQHLRETQPARGGIVRLPDGTALRRSSAAVWRLLRQSLTTAEIAEALQMTPYGVLLYLRRIRAAAVSFRQGAVNA